jgi:hypothetical protein
MEGGERIVSKMRRHAHFDNVRPVRARNVCTLVGDHGETLHARSSSPRSSAACLRNTNFWIFPVTVIGNPSTKRT